MSNIARCNEYGMPRQYEHTEGDPARYYAALAQIAVGDLVPADLYVQDAEVGDEMLCVIPRWRVITALPYANGRALALENNEAQYWRAGSAMPRTLALYSTPLHSLRIKGPYSRAHYSDVGQVVDLMLARSDLYVPTCPFFLSQRCSRCSREFMALSSEPGATSARRCPDCRCRRRIPLPSASSRRRHRRAS